MADQNPPQEQQEPTEQPPQEHHVSSQVCDACLENNLITDVGIIECARCSAPYCIHFASKIDQRYCVACFSDFSLEKSVITKTYEHYNEVTDTVRKYARRAREIKIGGMDWLFAQRKIHSLTDAELDMGIEYHRNIQSLLMIEYEQRRNEKMHRYAGVKLAIPTPSTVTTKTTTVKSTKTKSTKAQAQLSSLLDSLLAKGMSVDQLASMLKK